MDTPLSKQASLLDPAIQSAKDSETVLPKSIYKTTEWKLIMSAIIMSSLTLTGVIYTYFFDKSLCVTLTTAFGLHFIGGRGPSVFLCLARDMNPLHTLLFNFWVEVLVVLLVYPAIVLIMRDHVEINLFKNAQRRAERAALNNADRIKKFGLFGLFLFVMFPFAMTGPVVGAVIGYLLSYKRSMTLFVSFAGTFLALLIYVYFGEMLVAAVGDHGMLVKIILVLAVLIFVFLNRKTLYRYFFHH